MIGVFFCSHTNSTTFTNCCQVAICEDQACCPRCGEEVSPGKDATNHQRNVARFRQAFARQNPNYERRAAINRATGDSHE